MTIRRLTGLDSVFLAAESPGRWLHVMAVLLLDPETVPGGVSFDGFREFIARRIHLIPPLRRRLVEVPFGLGTPYWVEESNLDFERHIRRAAVPEPGGMEELSALAAEMDERPLDRSRPLWEMTWVEGVEGGRVGLVAKLHHSMMDGMAGMQFMASLFGRGPEIEDPPVAEPRPAEEAPGSLGLLVRSLPQLAGRPLRLARAIAGTAASIVLDRIAAPRDSGPGVPRTCLNAHATSGRSVAYTSLSLPAIRAVARLRGATVNDVALAIVAGALRRELEAMGELPDGPLVVAVPISTHEDDDDVMNSISAFFVSLATDLEDPFERLEAIRDATADAKRRQRGGGGGMLAWAEALLPLEMGWIAGLYSSLGLSDVLPPLCNAVVSNVPGPPVPLYLGGARLVGIHPLGPVFDGMGLNVTMLGREDSLDVGVVACRGVLPNLSDFVGGLEGALAELVAALPAAPYELEPRLH